MRRSVALVVLLGIWLIVIAGGAYLVFVAGASPFSQDLAETFFYQDLVAAVGVVIVCVVGAVLARLW